MAVLAAACRALLESGAPPAALATGLAPHGIPEFAALVLACGAGLSGAPAAGKKRLFVRAVAPLLAGAVAVEVWVTPLAVSLAA